MWSIRLRSRPRVDGGEPRPTRSTARLWFARFWHINEANREYAPWPERRRLSRKTSRRLCRERKTLTVERVAVALANKMARIAFAIMRGKTVCRESPA